MKKASNSNQGNDMLPEYDFKGKKGVRGKYAEALQKGYTVRITNDDGTVTIRHFIPRENAVVLDPDVLVYFPNSESVNRALRLLIELVPNKNTKQIAEKKTKYSKK